MKTPRSIVISAPSGAGKSTIVGALLAKFPQLAFSISACSRPPRGQEENGVHYYFLQPEQFKQKIEEGAFFEWEEVYKNNFYGTLGCTEIIKNILPTPSHIFVASGTGNTTSGILIESKEFQNGRVFTSNLNRLHYKIMIISNYDVSPKNWTVD